ncbi:hypothetical protein IF1G_07356 [Cordyceps javanica]|uniref:Uncharacterized protein n=1 Tax=Cordyceps javanica TaxID=43265 RepID=A0A545VL23_9HYPO|nr:hypothetical protein IF1G_07356 [Cordyceps javanica]TQW02356.1 hypothetical protein IF2G_10159 [Cordyceps javanica]
MHFLSNAAAILTVINYFAPKPNCSHGEPRVGICLVEKCDSSPGADGLKAVQPVERTSDFQIRTVKFNNTELGPGEYRAAFVCEDGENPPWMLSRSFTVDAAPPAEEGKCVHRSSTFSPAWNHLVLTHSKAGLVTGYKLSTMFLHRHLIAPVHH